MEFGLCVPLRHVETGQRAHFAGLVPQAVLARIAEALLRRRLEPGIGAVVFLAADYWVLDGEAARQMGLAGEAVLIDAGELLEMVRAVQESAILADGTGGGPVLEMSCDPVLGGNLQVRVARQDGSCLYVSDPIALPVFHGRTVQEVKQ